jgi:hypothetical protein
VTRGIKIENDLDLEMYRTSNDDIVIYVPTYFAYLSLTSLYSLYMNSLGFYTADLMELMGKSMRTRVGQVPRQMGPYFAFCRMLAIAGDVLRVPKCNGKDEPSMDFVCFGFGKIENKGIFGYCEIVHELMSVPMFICDDPKKYYERLSYIKINSFCGDDIALKVGNMCQSFERKLEEDWVVEALDSVELSSDRSSSSLRDRLQELDIDPFADWCNTVLETEDDLLDITCGGLEEAVRDMIEDEEPIYGTLIEDNKANVEDVSSILVTETKPIYDSTPEYNIVAKALLEPSRQVVYMDFVSQDSNTLSTELVLNDTFKTGEVNWIVYGAIRTKDLVRIAKKKTKGWFDADYFRFTREFDKSFYIDNVRLFDFRESNLEKFNRLINPYRKVRFKLFSKDVKFLLPVSWGLVKKKKKKWGPDFMARFDDLGDRLLNYKEGVTWSSCIKGYVKSLWANYGNVVLLLGPYEVEVS